jgi:TRAP-type C4-dicarboxylate transport system permease small subunit
MRALLDAIYRVALWLAALCLVAIALMVGLQLAGRLVDGAMRLAGFLPYGFVILSLAEIAANLLAAASFLALAATLKAGAHIRVTMVLSAFDQTARRWLEVWALAFAALAAAYMAWSIGRFAYFSFVFDEISPGVIPVPLAIPQVAMAVGLGVLTIAIVGELCTVAMGRPPSFRAAEDALTLGKEG